MSTNVKVSKLINKLELQQNELMQINNSFIIFPYQASGYLDYTNRGVEQNQVNVNDYETFKRVWTGNDACVLNWKDSIEFRQNEDKSISTQFQLGEILIGLLMDNASENELKQDASFSDYTSQQSRNTLSFRISAKFFTINENWNFYFYKIPEIGGSTLYRMINFNPEYLGRKVVAYVVDFITLNQDLANTGRAKQQNIMPNSPGQGYMEGQVFAPDTFATEGLVENVDYIEFPDKRIVSFDKRKQINNPIKKVVVKMFGPSVFSNISFMGREINQLSTLTEFGEPCIIFPMNLQNASTPTLYRSQSAETNFYWIQDATPTLLFWKDLFEGIKGAMTPVNEFKYQGFLTYNYANTIATNPRPASGGSYKYSLFGFLFKNASTGQYESNPWLMNSPRSQKATNMIYGCANTYNAYGGNKQIWDYMFDAYWVQKKYNVLPMNAASHIGFGWTLGSSLGAIVTGKFWVSALLLGVGIVGSLTSKLNGPFYEGFSGIMSAPLLDLLSEQYSISSSPGDKIDFSIFDTSNKETPSSAFFDGNTLTTAFEGDLTNKFVSNRVSNKELTTSNIGQKTYADGTNILSSGEPFLLNGDARLISVEGSNGFIIDSFNIQGIFNGEFSVEFLDIDNKVVWNGVYLSEGKWSGSSREINSWKNTSIIGRENTFFAEPLPYPKPLPDLISDLQLAYDMTKIYNVGISTSTYRDFFSPLWKAFEYSGGAMWVEVVWDTPIVPPPGIPRNLVGLNYHYRAFDTQILEGTFKSLDEFWNKYSSLIITYRNMTEFAADKGIKTFTNYSVTIDKTNTTRKRFNNFESYCWIDVTNLWDNRRIGMGKSFGTNTNSFLELVVTVKLDTQGNVVVTTTGHAKDRTSDNLGDPWFYYANACAKNVVWDRYLYWEQDFKLDNILFKAK